MTFNDVMSKLVTSHPEHSGLRVEFKLNAIRNLVNKGYVISTKLLLRSYLNRCVESSTTINKMIYYMMSENVSK